MFAVIRSGRLLFVFGVVLALAFGQRVAGARGRVGRVTAPESVRVFDVTDFGAKGDGKPIYDEDGESINGLKVMAAWRAACEYTKGPSKFPNALLLNVQEVDGVTLTGPGFIDASNRGAPRSKDSRRDIDFFELMPLITFYNATNAVVDGINCRNPAAFHVLVVLSRNITINNVRFDADYLAPQSDTSGVYISASTQVTVSNSFIRTGDNCIIVAPGSTQVHVNNVTCSAGQGISIGADPISDALDVKNVTVKNCTFKGTTFGASIFPRQEANPSKVSDIVFEDLVMEKVEHSVVIHQQMPPRPNKSIQVKVENVHIKNIIGTTTSRHGVITSCNPKLPCEGIQVSDIHLKYLAKSSFENSVLGHSP
ncbi:hypothetical protein vseg_012816 [Gypsophila vaccaria]